MHSARIISEFNRKEPGQYIFTAIAGQRSAAEGAGIFADVCLESSIGLIEGARHIRSAYALKRALNKYLAQNPPDLFLCIDGQGRNLVFGAAAQRMGIPSAYFFPPDVFLWGKWNITKLKKYDVLLCPIEPNQHALAAHGANAVYTGHPFSVFPDTYDKALCKKKMGFSSDTKILAIFSGSRLQEINSLTDVFIRAAALVMRSQPGVKAVCVPAHPEYGQIIKKKICENGADIQIVHACADEVLMASDISLAASGTITLQSACYGVPCIICYKISRLSYLAAKYILGIKKIGLPNILSGENLFPELINSACTAPACAEKISALLKDAHAYENLRTRLVALKNKIGNGRTYEVVHQEIRKVLDNRKK